MAPLLQARPLEQVRHCAGRGGEGEGAGRQGESGASAAESHASHDGCSAAASSLVTSPSPYLGAVADQLGAGGAASGAVQVACGGAAGGATHGHACMGGRSTAAGPPTAESVRPRAGQRQLQRTIGTAGAELVVLAAPGAKAAGGTGGAALAVAAQQNRQGKRSGDEAGTRAVRCSCAMWRTAAASRLLRPAAAHHLLQLLLVGSRYWPLAHVLTGLIPFLTHAPAPLPRKPLEHS